MDIVSTILFSLLHQKNIVLVQMNGRRKLFFLSNPRIIDYLDSRGKPRWLSRGPGPTVDYVGNLKMGTYHVDQVPQNTT